jgi:hypothetical protein
MKQKPTKEQTTRARVQGLAIVQDLIEDYMRENGVSLEWLETNLEIKAIYDQLERKKQALLSAIATPSSADTSPASGNAAVTGARYVVRYMELNSGWSWVVWDTHNPDDAITDLWTYETDAIRDCARRNAQEASKP